MGTTIAGDGNASSIGSCSACWSAWGIARETAFISFPPSWNLDPVDGYPVNNGVHPNGAGYAQIGASFYVWLKSWMASH